jgi:hypothetical protein
MGFFKKVFTNVIKPVAKAVVAPAKAVVKAAAPVAKPVAKAVVAPAKAVVKAAASVAKPVVKAVVAPAKAVVKAVAPVAPVAKMAMKKMAGGGMPKALAKHAAQPASKAHAGLRAGGFVRAADGAAKQGRTKGKVL